jgi:hypothetical protein
MAFDEQASHDTSDNLVITNDDPRHFLAYALEMIPKLLDLSLYIAAHFLPPFIFYYLREY